MTIFFLPEARDELLDAISYYENAHPGLGRRFKEEVDRSVLWIAEHYLLFRLRPNGYRKINLRIFPYGIPFIIKGDTLWVLALAHSARKPEYWIDRK